MSVGTASLWTPQGGQELTRHTLALVLRFVDPFEPAPPIASVVAEMSGMPGLAPFVRRAIPTPMRCRMSTQDRLTGATIDLEWEPLYSPRDGTYRFARSNIDARKPLENAIFFATGSNRFATPLPVSVEIEPMTPETATYWVPSPVRTLIAPSGPFANPTHRMTSYLMELEAYPTRVFRPPTGETAIRGIVLDAANAPRTGVEVALHDPAMTPWLYIQTDGDGRFLFRFPTLARVTPAPAEPSIAVTVRPIGGTPFPVVSVNPHPSATSRQALFSFGRTTDIVVQAA